MSLLDFIHHSKVHLEAHCRKMAFAGYRRDGTVQVNEKGGKAISTALFLVTKFR